jgi:pantoate--beta-alanine ligase
MSKKKGKKVLRKASRSFVKKSSKKKAAPKKPAPKKKQKMPPNPLKVIKTIQEMRKFSEEIHHKRRKIALVPTMGFLHEGHLSLIREAKKHAHVVVVSLFVNPLQFAPGEDLEQYPRDLAGDRKKVHMAGGHVLFVPTDAEMVSEGFQTYVDVTEITRDLCGQSRPGHFRGVTTIVSKLFNIIRPDVAVFGEKDYQQLMIVRRMVRDLNFAMDVIGVPTVRDADGMAMSSRNSYLMPDQRMKAVAIHRGLRKAERLFANGERDSSELAAAVVDLLHEQPDLNVEYVAVCDPKTLQRIPAVEKDAVLLVAVKVGATRLIDGLHIGAKSRK